MNKKCAAILVALWIAPIFFAGCKEDKEDKDDKLWLLLALQGCTNSLSAISSGGCELTLTGDVTVTAGSPGSSGSTDADGTAARFNSPFAITSDGTNLYVADTLNHTIRKIVISTGTVTTLAGTAGASGTADGTGAAARFNAPQGITFTGSTLYVADQANHTIRSVNISTGAVTTLAGTAGASGSTDATGSSARFNTPVGIVGDGTNLYVADTGNQLIHKIVISTGVVTTLAGSVGATGTTDATGTDARFNTPRGIGTYGGILYISDTQSHTIRKLDLSTNAVTTFAGSAGSSGSTDGLGSAARFNNPWKITTDGIYLYVADSNNHTIRKMTISTGEIVTLAGTAGVSGTTDANGTGAKFNLPTGIVTDGADLYVADTNNHAIRKID